MAVGRITKRAVEGLKDGAQVIPLAAPALAVLSMLPRLPAYVLPGET